MKAAELRQSILQAAVQGKLVPHNPQDEPASELLKRIQQEKARLIKEGKLKKEKPLPPVAEDEILYDLPVGWEWCRFGTLVYNRDSERNPVSRVEREKRQKFYDYYGASGIIDKIDNFLFNETLLLIGEDGANLLARSTPIAFLASGKYWVNNHAHVLDGISEQFLEYLALYINAIDLSPYVTGTAQPKMNQERMNSILVAIPSESEQKRILTKVNKLMLLCDKLEAEERKLDALEAHFAEYLPKTILQAATQGKLVLQNSHDEPASELLKRIQQEKAQLVKEGKLKKERPLPPISEDEIPCDLPEGWVWCRLYDIGQIIGGATPDSHESSYYTKPGQGISWLTPADMTKYTQNNYISHGAKDITQAGYNSCSTTLMPPGSIIFSSRAPIGHIAFSSKEVCTNQGFKSVVTYMAAVAPWILYALKSKVDDIQSRASGTTFKEVSGKFMESEIIPLPPLAEQQRITQKVDELIDLCNGLKDTYIAPMPLTKPDNIIPFPATQKEEETLLAARGDMEHLSNEAMQAIDDLFSEDEE